MYQNLLPNNIKNKTTSYLFQINTLHLFFSANLGKNDGFGAENDFQIQNRPASLRDGILQEPLNSKKIDKKLLVIFFLGQNLSY